MWLIVVALHCWLFTSNTIISVAVCHRDGMVTLSRPSSEHHVAFRVLTSALMQTPFFILPYQNWVSEVGSAALVVVLTGSLFAG